MPTWQPDRSRPRSTCWRGATHRTYSPSCRARITWDRVDGTITPRPGARQLAVANAGTIPDRGLFRVDAPGRRSRRRTRRGDGLREPSGRRVPPRGELVAHRRHRARPGGGGPRAGEPRRPTCRSGTAMLRGGRSRPAGRSVSSSAEWRPCPPTRPRRLLRDRYRLDPLAASNLVAYLAERAGGGRSAPHRPDDRGRAIPR